MTSTPTNEEQFLLQLINRAREDPHAEMQRVLAHPDNQGGINFFNVDTALALSQVQGLGAEAPLAWNGDLADAADWQANDMIVKNYFDHQYQPDPNDPSTWGPDIGQRITNEGYVWTAAGENLGRGVSSLEESHGQLYIDWGFTPTGIQSPPGHRDNMLSSNFKEIGITYTTTPSTAAPLFGNITVQKFANGVNDYNILGVAIDDLDNDDFYDIGEGLGGITVTAVGGGNTYTTTTWSSGGYTLPVAANVTYTVTYSGAALGSDQTHTIVMGTDNVAQDVEKGGTGTGGGGNTPSGGDDTLTGDGGDNTINALGGNDSVDAGGGDDTVDAGTGNDTVNAGAGNDSVNGGGGSDSVNGDDGNDTLDGSFGDDAKVSGGPGNDRLLGGGGNDSLCGDGDNDTILGGSNNDTLDGGDGDDSLYGEIGQDVINGGLGNDRMFGANAKDTLNGGDGDDTMLGQGSEDLMQGGAGMDSMLGGASADSMFGEDDNDFMDGGAFNDTMDGGAGNDSMKGGSGLDSLDGGIGNDTMDGGTKADVMNGGDGDDSMDGGLGNDNMTGGDGNDTINGGNAKDTIKGGAGFDVLDGGSSADVFDIGANEGGDTITGGTGGDTFIFRDFFGSTTPAGQMTTITDFQQGQDVIDISDVQFMTDLSAITVSVVGGTDTHLDFGFGDEVTLQNWTGTLQSDDFVFWLVPA